MITVISQSKLLQRDCNVPAFMDMAHKLWKSAFHKYVEVVICCLVR